jgi:hypothetical protein
MTGSRFWLQRIHTGAQLTAHAISHHCIAKPLADDETIAIVI